MGYGHRGKEGKNDCRFHDFNLPCAGLLLFPENMRGNCIHTVRKVPSPKSMRCMLKIGLAVSLVCSVGVASAANFTTESFAAEYTIRRDRTVEVNETVSVTFTKPSHGLQRPIPVRTKGDKGIRQVFIEDLSVEADTGSGFRSTPFTTKEDGDLKIRIGDPNALLTGKAAYRLHYKLRGAITNFDSSRNIGEHAEFFWNVVPAHWATPIAHASAHVTLPSQGSQVQARVYWGSRGSASYFALSSGGTGETTNLSGKLSSSRLDVETKAELPSSTGITVVLVIPIDWVDAPPEGTEGGAYMQPFGGSYALPNKPAGYFLPLVPVALFAFINRKRFKPFRRRIDVAFEPPEGIGPLEAGTLIDLRMNVRDLIAGIVSLAQKKAARLIHLPGDASFIIELLGLPTGSRITTAEANLYGVLLPFGPTIVPTELRGGFAPAFRSLSSMTSDQLRASGYLHSSIGAKATVGCSFALGIGLLGFALFPFFGFPAIIGSVIAFAISLYVLARWNVYTQKGFEAKDQLLGLKEFITRSYQRELRHFAKTDFNQALYDKLLPYAIAFNAVDQWTSAFQGVQLEPPDWYTGYDPSVGMWYASLGSDLTTFDLVVTPAAYASSGGGSTSFDSGGGFSSGSGFDGGGGADMGGGGGGGDSW